MYADISAASCKELLQNGTQVSGVYKLRLGDEVKSVFCDMETRGGGWTVIQRRGDFGRNKTYFLRKWDSYKKGTQSLSFLMPGNEISISRLWRP